MKTLTRMFLAAVITLAAMSAGLAHADDMKEDLSDDGMKKDTMMKDSMDKS